MASNSGPPRDEQRSPNSPDSTDSGGLLAWIRSVWPSSGAASAVGSTGDPAVATGGTRADGGRRETALYQCETCGTVYIATEKETCSSCKTGVDEVPATLSV